TRCYRDWSSDVCSSDLNISAELGFEALFSILTPLFECLRLLLVNRTITADSLRRIAHELKSAEPALDFYVSPRDRAFVEGFYHEIGRASCRERMYMTTR